MEKVSELIIKGKLRLCLLAGIDPAETIVPFTTDEIKSYGKKMNHGKELVLFFGGEINRNYPQSERLNLIRKM